MFQTTLRSYFTDWAGLKARPYNDDGPEGPSYSVGPPEGPLYRIGA